MSFVLDDRWVWDFWIARDGPEYHLFFLQADRSLRDPELRHWNVSVGHAVSRDLSRWTDLGTCLAPSSAPAWDDGTTWTGSVIRHRGLWHLFYTGTSKSEDRRKQRIGLATSSDLHNWQRHPANPVVDLDPRYYEEFDPACWHDRSLRDPWVASDPSGSGFRMWFTARANGGAADGRGVIGTAWSDDLVRWSVEPPATEPGEFGEVEVPQFLTAGGRSYLLFSTSARRTSAARLKALAGEGQEAETGTHYFAAEGPNATWRLGPMPFMAGTAGALYAGRAVQGPSGDLQFLAFVGEGADGEFVGGISDPIPLIVEPDGRLALASAQPDDEEEPRSRASALRLKSDREAQS